MTGLALKGLKQQPLRRALRCSTRDAHDRIEALWAPDKRFASLASYLSFLRTVLHVHTRVGLAAAQARGGSAEIDLEQERIAALCADLGLGQYKAGAICVSPDYAWGVGYVLNGSAIGANMILRDAFLQPRWPDRYLKLGKDYVKSGGLQKFFTALNDANPGPEIAMLGARETFEMLERSVS